MKTKRGRLVREPYGIVGIISPWNYPFSISRGHPYSGGAGGGEHRGLKAFRIYFTHRNRTGELRLDLCHTRQVCRKRIFQVIPGDGATGAALIETATSRAATTDVLMPNAAIESLCSAESVPTGKRIARSGGRRLLPVASKSLGGKDPMLVLGRC